MWVFGKPSRWASLESSSHWGMVGDTFERHLENYIQMLGIKFEGNGRSQKAFGNRKDRPKNKQKKSIQNVIFMAWVISSYQMTVAGVKMLTLNSRLRVYFPFSIRATFFLPRFFPLN